MKKYYYWKDENGTHRYIHIFKETTKDECSMCNGMKHFLDVTYPQEKERIPKRIVNLCKANLKRHQATGKHWKSIGEQWTH